MSDATLNIPLTGRCGDRRVVRGWTTVPDDDFGRGLLEYNWHLTGDGYAGRNRPRPRRGALLLHRVIHEHHLGPIPDGLEVDHADRDKLNNVPSNLRAISHAMNAVNCGRRSNNTAGYHGVRLHTAHRGSKPWQARVTVGGRSISLGYFATDLEAAVAVNEAYALYFPHVPVPNPCEAGRLQEHCNAV